MALLGQLGQRSLKQLVTLPVQLTGAWIIDEERALIDGDGISIEGPIMTASRRAFLSYAALPAGVFLQASQRAKRALVPVGTQRCSGEHVKSAVQLAADGKLGRVSLIKVCVRRVHDRIGRPAERSPVGGVDCDVWPGPAPNRFDGNWRFVWDYASGELGNQGLGVLDAALRTIQLMYGFERAKCLPRRVSAAGGICSREGAKELPDTHDVVWDFGDLLLQLESRSVTPDVRLGRTGTSVCTGFYGTEGTLLVEQAGWKLYRPDGLAEERQFSGGLHEPNFVESFRSRPSRSSDMDIRRLTTTLYRLGNIAYKLRRDVRFDPATESFPGDAAANSLFGKQSRALYGLLEL